MFGLLPYPDGSSSNKGNLRRCNSCTSHLFFFFNEQIVIYFGTEEMPTSTKAQSTHLSKALPDFKANAKTTWNGKGKKSEQTGLKKVSFAIDHQLTTLYN